MSTKGNVDDVSPDILAFLNYVDSGIVSGKFVEELDVAVNSVKSNEKARHDFMTLQMYLLEHELKAEERGLKKGEMLKAEAVATKLIQRGRPIQEIHEDTGLSLERIHELEKISFQS